MTTPLSKPSPARRSLQRLVMPDGWRLEEVGRYAHETDGGVCRERQGSWYGYPRGGNPPYKGPFSTAAKAAKWVSSIRHNGKAE